MPRNVIRTSHYDNLVSHCLPGPLVRLIYNTSYHKLVSCLPVWLVYVIVYYSKLVFPCLLAVMDYYTAYYDALVLPCLLVGRDYLTTYIKFVPPCLLAEQDYYTSCYNKFVTTYHDMLAPPGLLVGLVCLTSDYNKLAFPCLLVWLVRNSIAYYYTFCYKLVSSCLLIPHLLGGLD